MLLLSVAAPASAASPVGGTLDLDSQADATFTPGGPEAKAGEEAAVGDVNGDGITDYAVGYPYASRLGRDQNGVVKVVFGHSGGGISGRIDLGDGEPGFEIAGSSNKIRLGTTIAGAGDVNGDGLSDVLIGSPGTRLTGSTSPTPEGFVFVVFGKRTSMAVDTKTTGSTGFRIVGAPGDRAGAAVSGVGDVDGDGRSEIAVGAPAALGGAGRVMVVLSNGRPANVNLATIGAGALEVDGAAAGDAAGTAVAGMPDVNGDGRADLAIGAPAAAQGGGLVAIVRLPAPGAGALSLASLPGGFGAVRTGSDKEALGAALASVGDLSRDGVGDLAVGAPLASRFGRSHGGAVYLLSGAAGGTGSLAATAPWLIGDHFYDRLGTSLDAGAPPGAAVAPYADAVAVGAPMGYPKDPNNAALMLGRQLAGAVYVVFPAIAGVGTIDLGLPPPGTVERLVGPARTHTGASVSVARDGVTTSVLVGTSAPKDVAAWGVSDVKPPAFPQPQGDDCVRKTNLEVIVDDSGSMNTNDPQFLARQALDLLVTKPGNLNRITGAVEFGTRARQIFAPVPAPGTSTGALHDLLAGLMSEHIRHDAVKTNFNAAFVAARAMNPIATARILITDGFATREGFPKLDDELVKAVPTWVIGLGRTRAPAAEKQMANLARLSGGGYFPRVDDQELAGVVDTIDSVGLCDLHALPTATIGAGGGAATTPTLDNGVKGALPESTSVSARKPVARFKTRLAGNPSVIDLTLSWADTSAKKRKKAAKPKRTAFDLLPLVMVAGNRQTTVPVGKLRRALRGRTVRFRGLKIKGSRGATYVTLRIAGLGGASPSSVPAHAASRFDWAHMGVRRKAGRKKGGHRAQATAARAATTTRVSLSAYRRR